MTPSSIHDKPQASLCGYTELEKVALHCHLRTPASLLFLALDVQPIAALVHFRTLVTLRRVRVRVRVELELTLGLVRVRIRVWVRLRLDLGLGLC